MIWIAICGGIMYLAICYEVGVEIDNPGGDGDWISFLVGLVAVTVSVALVWGLLYGIWEVTK